MSTSVVSDPVIYPESDGKPMADNTLQFRWIKYLADNLELLYEGRADVFAGGNLFWYPVEGFIEIAQAPDVFVVLGCPPGERRTYNQWEEGNVPMTVVFEIRSHNDTDAMMLARLEFYDRYDVAEYYMYDPQRNIFEAYVRRGNGLGPQRLTRGSFVSPLLNIRFQTARPELLVFRPNGEPFCTRAEQEAQTTAARQRAELAEKKREAAEQRSAAAQKAQKAAEQQRKTAQKAQEVAEQQRKAAQKALEAAEQRNARLRELSRKARRGQATPEELAELDRMEDDSPA